MNDIAYASTRGAPAVSFAEAVLRGLAPDGGLYLPTRIAPFTMPKQPLSFAELALKFLAPYTNCSEQELAHIVGNAFAIPVPLVQVSTHRYVLELFHGPTFAFKDFAARFLAAMLDHVLTEQNERAVIVVATSGDTGSAVADAFAGRERIRIVLTYPAGMVSSVQEQQIVTPRTGVLPLAVRGTFDDCQRLVKTVLEQPTFGSWRTSAANSINIARLLPQATYYAYLAQQLAAAGLNPSTVPVVVPSGNLGNLAGGLLAKQAGVPLGNMIAAHNANRFFPDVLAGTLPDTAKPATIPTVSNAMDVGMPSNYERLREWFGAGVPPPTGISISEADTLAAMHQALHTHGYLACPHTAVGFAAADALVPAGQPHVVLSTAHPAKFPEAVMAGTGTTPSVPEGLENIPAPATVAQIDPNFDALSEVLSSWLTA